MSAATGAASNVTSLDSFSFDVDVVTVASGPDDRIGDGLKCGLAGLLKLAVFDERVISVSGADRVDQHADALHGADALSANHRCVAEADEDVFASRVRLDEAVESSNVIGTNDELDGGSEAHARTLSGVSR